MILILIIKYYDMSLLLFFIPILLKINLSIHDGLKPKMG